MDNWGKEEMIMKGIYTRLLRNINMGLLLVLMSLTAAQADPGNLAQQPLFLGTTVQPNIFFGVDDSGSMDWEVILTEGALVAHPGNPNSGNLDLSPNDNIEDLELCVGYNALAYDPNTIYTPWRGEDDDGIDYADQTVTASRNNPYDADEGTENLLFPDGVSNDAVYGTWVDGFGTNPADGIYQDGECPIGAPNDGSGFDSRTFTDARWVTVTSLSTAQQTNYANWHSYYRKREFVAKRAISELIFDSNQRMGLATLHNNNSVGTAVSDMTAGNNRVNLLDTLGQINSTGGTPLRLMLENIGEYFDRAGNDSDHSALGFSDSSPILSAVDGGECQQNFSVIFSDGFWNGGAPSVGNTDTDGAGDFDGGSHADTFSNTLADVAMEFYERDLATSIDNQVPTIEGLDENEAQHLVTYTVAFGVNGTLTANPPNRDDAFTWPEPVANAATTVDDMRHAAWNGRGEFLSAQNPDELIQALTDALSSIESRVGTASSATFNSNQLDTGTQIYLTQFNSENWSGDLLSFDIDVATNGDITFTPGFTAADQLDADNPATRNVFTYDGTVGTVFRLYPELTTAQQNDLRTNPDGTDSADADLAQARLEYIRGSRVHEADGTAYDFRERESILGDIVHSSPNFVGVPDDIYPDLDPFGTADERYSQFRADQANRQGMVYVGANDGMLHGFNGETGEETLAYIPSMLFDDSLASGLHYLTDPDYSHRYYVDLTVTVNDAYISTSSGAIGTPSWTTVLVGGLRAGGKGLFALDITNPAFSEGTVDQTVLWEFNECDADIDCVEGVSDGPELSILGSTFSQPQIALLNNGEWAVIIGNGYNSDAGDAALIILFIEEGADGEWTLNSDYRVIRTESGDSVNPNGLGQVRLVDLNADQVIDRVYSGDVDGNLWAFDISDDNESAWDVAYSSGGAPAPLFTATDDNSPSNPILDNERTAITVASAVTRSELTNLDNLPNVLVLFGSGQYLTDADPTDTQDQAFYAVWDAGVSGLDRTNLVEQDITETTTSNPDTSAGAPANITTRTLTENAVDYPTNPTGSGSQDFGWFIALPTEGERVIVDPVVRLGVVFFLTLIPNAGACADGGGSGFLMVADAASGGAPNFGVLDINNDGTIDDSDQVNDNFVQGLLVEGIPTGQGFIGGSNNVFITTTDGVGSDSITAYGITDLPEEGDRRLSWQELIE